MEIFSSFLMGGFECADHINRSGERINLLAETGHDVRADEDYAALKRLGITCAREGICWSQVEKNPGIYDFSEVANRIKCAENHGIQLVWDLIHFGYPDGMFPTHPLFCERFEALCSAFASFYALHATQQLLVVPINEISFLSWHSGEVRGTVPFAVNSGWDIKYHLCKAAIAGIKALKAADPSCRIILVEPLVKVHSSCEEDWQPALDSHEHQFQAMDVISGKICPELGGSAAFLDVLGFNYYWNCQWEHSGPPLPWPEGESCRRVGLSELLCEAFARYGKPMFLSETGHFGSGRVEWLAETLAECHKAIKLGVPLQSMCIYPIIDRPDWDNLEDYPLCGVFDLDASKNRIPHEKSVKAIQLMQKIISAQQQKRDSESKTDAAKGMQAINEAVETWSEAVLTVNNLST